MTPAEKILWQELRGNKWESISGGTPALAGGAWGRSSRDCVVDFYCHKAALVVEVDGDIHDLQQEEDARREKVLREMGLRVVRFRNEEVPRDLFAVVGMSVNSSFILHHS